MFSNRSYDLKTAVDSSFRKSYTDIAAFACKDAGAATVMLWNYHDDDIKSIPETVEVIIKGIDAKQIQLSHFRIDESHSNSYEVWKKIGSPQNPTAEQVTELERAGQLQMYTSPQWIKVVNGTVTIEMQLPRQAVSLLKLDW